MDLVCLILHITKGCGATAIVYKAFCKSKNEYCAIKIVQLENNISIDELTCETRIIATCNHENVVQYYTSFVKGAELWLIIELLDGGSLRDIIKHRQEKFDCDKGVLDEPFIATVLKYVLNGLMYFHKNGLIHRDIKAGNILLGKEGQVKIADFGVSALLATNNFDQSRQQVRHTFVGTPCWMAPEVTQQDRGYSFAADIWSLGITAIEMATGQAPYCQFSAVKILLSILTNDPPNLDSVGRDNQFEKYSSLFRKVIKNCLQKDPTKRPTAEQLVKHKFFKQADKSLVTDFYKNYSSDIERIKKINEQNALPSEMAYRACNNWTLDDFDHCNPDPESNTLIQEPAKVHITLLIRNTMNNLDILEFDYFFGQDTPGGLAKELETYGVVKAKDKETFSENIKNLILNRNKIGEETFDLDGGPNGQILKGSACDVFPQ